MNYTILKKLAGSIKYQTIYHRAKDLGSLHLFNNSSDFSKLQIWFLHYLEVYSSLYSDLANNESYISEDVIKDTLRTEAYLLYRNKKNRSKKDKEEVAERVRPSGIPSIIFKSKRGRK